MIVSVSVMVSVIIMATWDSVGYVVVMTNLILMGGTVMPSESVCPTGDPTDPVLVTYCYPKHFANIGSLLFGLLMMQGMSKNKSRKKI